MPCHTYLCHIVIVPVITHLEMAEPNPMLDLGTPRISFLLYVTVLGKPQISIRWV